MSIENIIEIKHNAQAVQELLDKKKLSPLDQMCVLQTVLHFLQVRVSVKVIQDFQANKSIDNGM